jgi:hypothetical protein
MKTHNVFLALLFLLAVGIGCDGDGAGGDPCAEFAAVAECPCDYFKVPMTTDCWGGVFCSCENIDFDNCTSSQCDSPPSDGCALSQPVGDGARFANTAIRDGSMLGCSVGFTLGNIPPFCDVQPEDKTVTSEAQFETCLCRLAQYTTELAQKNIVQIDPAQASYSCEPSPTPTP